MELATRGNAGKEMIRWLFDHFYGCTVTENAVESATKHGNLELLQFFKKHAISAEDDNWRDVRDDPGVFPLSSGVRHFVRWGSRYLAAAAEGNHPKLIWWLFHSIPVHPGHPNLNIVVSAAVRNQDMILVEWVHSNLRCHPSVAYHPMKEAVLVGRIDIMEWLFRHGYTECALCVEYAAIKNGDRTILDWLIDRNVVKVAKLIREAADQRRLDILKYLYSQYWQHPDLAHTLYDSHKVRKYALMWAMQHAVSNGDLGIIQWLQEAFADEVDVDLFSSRPSQDFDVRYESHIIDTAAKKGHLNVVKYLHHATLHEKNGKKRKRDESSTGSRPMCSSAVMDEAAANNHLEVVQCLHENRSEGCTCHAIHGAASNGHLEMVKWLTRNRSEGYTAQAMDVAAKNGHLDVVKWLHDDEASCITKAMNEAAEKEHLDVVKWLHRFRTEACTTDAMNGAARCGKLAVVKWLHENRSEGCTTAAMNTAAVKGRFEVVKWLHNHRTEGCTTAAMDGAASAGHFDLILFLHAHRHEGCSELAFENTDDESIHAWMISHYKFDRHSLRGS